MVWGDGTGQVGKMLDVLSDRCRIIDVVNLKLRGMLVRRGWTWTRKYAHEVWAPTQREKSMACIILKCWQVTMHDGETFELYSTRDLSALDSTLRYAVSINRIDKAGVGTDGVAVCDGKPVLNEFIPTDRVTRHCNLAETNRILEAHRNARKILKSTLDSNP